MAVTQQKPTGRSKLREGFRLGDPEGDRIVVTGVVLFVAVAGLAVGWVRDRGRVAASPLEAGSVLPSENPHGEGDLDRLRIGALGAVTLQVVDSDGRVAGCGFEPWVDEEVPDSDCEIDAELTERCPPAVAVLVEVPAGRYQVRLASTLVEVAAPLHLGITEVREGEVKRTVTYRLELPAGGRATTTYRPGTSPVVEILREDRQIGEIEAELQVDRMRGIDRRPPDLNLEALCEAVRAEPVPSEEDDEATLDRLRHVLPPEIFDEMRREQLRHDLRDAVAAGRADEVRRLLAEGAEVAGLSLAAAQGHREVVQVLLDAGADIDRRSRRGETALSMAYRNDHPAVAGLLLERGAKRETRLVLRAVVEDRPSWLELLLRFDTPVDGAGLVRRLQGAYRRAPADPATPALAQRVLDLLFAETEWRRYEWDLLSSTICRPDPSPARRLMDRGVDLNQKGGALLRNAVKTDRGDCVERLLDWGADANAASAKGLTPLMVAMDPVNPPLARRLIRAGADPNARDETGRTPLMMLAADPVPSTVAERRVRFQEEQRAVVDMLVEAGADLDARTESGDNALLAAASQAKLWLVEHLLDGGALLTGTTWEAMAALHGSAWRIRLERMWQERDLPLPSILELFPLQPDSSVDLRAQRRTMRDLREVGQALFTWVTAELSAAAAAAPRTWSASDFRLLSLEAMEELLTPHYLPWVPAEDGWGHPIEYRVNGLEQIVEGAGGFLLRSPGRDGRFSTDEYEPGTFPAESFDEDIVYVDGRFLRWPEGMQRSQSPRSMNRISSVE